MFPDESTQQANQGGDAMSKYDPSAPRNAGRREMLKRVGAAGAVGAVAATAAMTGSDAIKSAHAQGKQPLREALETLTAAEADTLEAICARIIPSDDGPGAAEARAAHYIDRALTGPIAGSKPAYVTGLAALDNYARAEKGAPFAKLAPADQDALLAALEKNAAKAYLPNGTAFFNMVRTHTIQGTFCDPYYGGNHNYVGWDMIGYPGIRMAVSPDEQSMSKPPRRVRKSAYDEAMFSKRGGGHH
jgi:gluconate 2-dehydrogenase gamma chain